VSAPRWTSVLGPVVALIALGGQWYTARAAETRVVDATHLALARHAAAYLGVVTPGTAGAGYDAPRLLSGANALAAASFWPGELQVAYGQTPLVPDLLRMAPLPDSAVARLEQGVEGMIATHTTVRAAVVPLLDRDQWTPRGWVAAWDAVPRRLPPAHAQLLTLLALMLVLLAGVVADRGGRERWTRWVAPAAGVTALLLAPGLAVTVHRTAVAATDLRLLTLAQLVEIAATAPAVPQARLPEIGAGARPQGVASPAGAGIIERGDSAGVPHARIIAATPRTQRGLAFSVRPFEADLGALPAQLLGWALLTALAAWFTSWVGRSRRNPARLASTLTAWGFLAPAALHLLAFSFLPALFTMFLAFHRWDLVGQGREFVGLANLVTVLTDGSFLHSLGVTALYALHVPATVVLALCAAVLLDRSGIGVRLLRALLFLPFISSVVAVALVWQWVYQPESGLLNAGLGLLGIAGPDWLGDPRSALLALMVMSVWVQLGYQMVVFLGGLQAIPAQYHDAARMDGAGPLARFLWVTLPLLRPTLLFVLVTGVIGSFQVFTYVAVMTEGGPLHATDVAVYRIYQEAWEFLRFGTASAMSLILLVLLLALTWVQFRWLGRRVELV
jgi:multiple sugar transport system permease protein